MRRYKMTLAYDGTHYSGWQRQPRSPSIQEEVEKRLSLLLRAETPLVGAGRTDAGVHARGQVAHFDTMQEIIPSKFLYSLNGLLPPDIRVREVTAVPPSFHACRSALVKIYHYHLWLSKINDPFFAKYHLPVYEEISLPLLREAASHFVGTKDFATFANVGSSAQTSVRTIRRITVVEQEGGGVRLEFEGEGFLYKMVRNIVGTLLDVVRGKRAIETIPALFASRDRRVAGRAAAARGLFLVEVRYNVNVNVPSCFAEGNHFSGTGTGT